MNLTRKMEIARQAIGSITRHDDEDLETRREAAEELIAFVNTEMQEANDRRKARIQKEREEAAAKTE